MALLADEGTDERVWRDGVPEIGGRREGGCLVPGGHHQGRSLAAIPAGFFAGSAAVVDRHAGGGRHVATHFVSHFNIIYIYSLNRSKFICCAITKLYRYWK